MFLSVDTNVLLVSMSVGVSQDLYKVPELWYFLTFFITSPGDQSVALKLDENICGESNKWKVAVFLINSFVPFRSIERPNH